MLVRPIYRLDVSAGLHRMLQAAFFSLVSLIPVWEARGAAIASIAGEAVLALTAVALLVRARPALRPAPGRMARILLAAALAALFPGLPSNAA